MRTCSDCAYFVKDIGFCSNYDFNTKADTEACDEFDEAGMCCANCTRCYKARKADYSHGGCEHSDMEGYICMVFADEGIATWMVGVDRTSGKCERYTPKGRHKRD